MEQVAEGVWTVPAPQTYFGLLVNTRMTVCRLSDGGLALISPVRADEDLLAAVSALGPVRAIVSPNLLHHLYLGGWMEPHPDALAYGPPGLSAKRPDLTLHSELGESFDEAFGADLQRFPVAGMPKLNESLFLHRSSSTLVVTDFCFNMPEAKGFTWLFAWMTGVDKHTRCEPSVRILIRDKVAFRDSLLPLRGLEIQHLSMCHHSVLSEGAAEALQQVLDQLGVPPDAAG